MEGLEDGIFREALGALPFPVCIAGKGGRILYANSAALRVFGGGDGAPSLPDAVLGIAGEAFRTGRTARTAVSARVAGEQSVEFPCEAIPLVPPGGGEPAAVVLAAHVCGEEDPLLELLVRNVSRRKLRELLAAIRHDILNQLTILIGFLQYSEDLCEDPQLRDFIGREIAAGRSIQSIIEFTRKFQDLATQDPAWVPLAALITPQEVQAIPRGVRIEVDCGDFEVYSSPLLSTVFSTLIGNAVDHARGLSRVTISAAEEGGDLVVVVEDDGPGIPPGEKKVLFERGHGRGAGYSLWLAREIVDICGGTIRECGEEGKGARFEIRMPRGLWRRAGKPAAGQAKGP
ncbi:MAG: PAS domain-containing sensor histidine kinase [Methanolinea sp.]|nr:PAS domain-containing sensor histidine kinase [Methanolinea sp.]